MLWFVDVRCCLFVVCWCVLLNVGVRRGLLLCVVCLVFVVVCGRVLWCVVLCCCVFVDVVYCSLLYVGVHCLLLVVVVRC